MGFKDQMAEFKDSLQKFEREMKHISDRVGVTEVFARIEAGDRERWIKAL